MNEPTIVDRLFAALAAGDLAGLGDCLAPEARVWHSFDGIAHDRAASLEAFSETIARFPERGVADVRRHPVADGLVQQHLFFVRTGEGRRIAWPACVVVRIAGSRIARIDEYIDRAGGFDPGEGPFVTPGLGAATPAP